MWRIPMSRYSQKCISSLPCKEDKETVWGGILTSSLAHCFEKWALRRGWGQYSRKFIRLLVFHIFLRCIMKQVLDSNSFLISLLAHCFVKFIIRWLFSQVRCFTLYNIYITKKVECGTLFSQVHYPCNVDI